MYVFISVCLNFSIVVVVIILYDYFMSQKSMMPYFKAAVLTNGVWLEDKDRTGFTLFILNN